MWALRRWWAHDKCTLLLLLLLLLLPAHKPHIIISGKERTSIAPPGKAQIESFSFLFFLLSFPFFSSFCRATEWSTQAKNICTFSRFHLRFSFHFHLSRNRNVSLKPVLNLANVCSPNTSDTSTNYDSFLIELLVRRIWFGQSKLYFVLIWLVMRCKLRPELAADVQQTAWSKM